MMMGLEYEVQKKRKKEGLTATISPDSFLGPGLGNCCFISQVFNLTTQLNLCLIVVHFVF